MNGFHKEFKSYLRKIKIHFYNNPEKLYSVKYFSKKYEIKYARAFAMLERLRRQGFVLRFYLSANQTLRAWGVPHPIFSLYVLNRTGYKQL
jgi:adenine-specific DNA methylase